MSSNLTRSATPAAAARSRAHLELLRRQGDAEHVDVGDPVQIQREPAPAAADVEHPLAGLQVDLGGEVGLLVELGLLQAVARVGEVAAAILHVGFHPEPVEVVADVIMVGDVALRLRASS